jgi:hypothetical protein
MFRFFCCIGFGFGGWKVACCKGDFFAWRGLDERPRGFVFFEVDSGPCDGISTFLEGIIGSFCIVFVGLTGSGFLWTFFLNGSSSSSSDPPNRPFLGWVYLEGTGFVYLVAVSFYDLLTESSSSDEPNKPFLDLTSFLGIVTDFGWF